MATRIDKNKYINYKIYYDRYPVEYSEIDYLTSYVFPFPEVIWYRREITVFITRW